MAPNSLIQSQDLPPEILASDSAEQRIPMTWIDLLRDKAAHLIKSDEGKVIEKLTQDLERTLIEVALTATAGRKKEAAEKLGWGRNTLTRKLKELGFSDTETNDD